MGSAPSLARPIEGPKLNEELQSFLIGTIPLDIVMVVAIGLSALRGPGVADSAMRRRTLVAAGAAIAVQSAHFAEEWIGGFNCRFPELLGLAPWSVELWATFNLFWIGLWVLSMTGIRARVHVALFPVWFLGIAGALNCVAHPLLALAAEGYFPGLWTSPLCGLSGGLLLRQLGELTRNGRTSVNLA